MSNLEVYIICPLEKEFHALSDTFGGELRSIEFDAALLYQLDSDEQSANIHLCLLPEKSDVSSANVTTILVERFSPSLVVSFGIAGAVSDDLALGDVCVSRSISDLVKAKKVRDKNGDGQSEYYSDDATRVPRNLITSLQKIRIEQKSIIEDWQLNSASWLERNVSPEQIATLSAKLERTPVREFPRWKLGNIASAGGVIDHAETRKVLSDRDSELLAVENECAGIAAAAAGKQITAISVRGISDFADGNKKLIDEVGDGVFREYAARNAAALLKLILEDPSFLKSVEQMPSSTKTRTAEVSVLDGVYLDLKGKVESFLPDGISYEQGSFPVPKIQKAGSSTKLHQQVEMFGDQDLISPRRPLKEVLKKSSVVLISEDLSKFDPSAPYIMADDLFSHEIDGKICICYVSASTYHSYQGLRSISKTSLDPSDEATSIQVYFVFGLRSGDRRAIELLSDLQKYPEQKFVLFGEFHDSDGTVLEFCDDFEDKIYNLADPSVDHVSTFLRKQLGYAPEESDTDAIKIRGAFQRFNLPIRLSYLSRFTRDGLNRFLDANNILDILELFNQIMLVDAQELNTGTDIGKDTRARFLEYFAINYLFETDFASVDDVQQAITNFSDKYDLGLDAKRFLRAFIDANILVEVQGSVGFVFGIMRVYYIARAAMHDEVKLAELMSLDSSGDLDSIFSLQLLVEMGADISEAVAKIETELAEVHSSEEHQTTLLHKFGGLDLAGQLRRLISRSKQAARTELHEIEFHDPDKKTETMEQIQDFAADMRRILPSFEEDAEKKQDDPELEGKLQDLLDTSRLMGIISVLIGSGAETNETEIKRRLARAVMRAGARVFELQLDEDIINFSDDSARDALTEKFDVTAENDDYEELQRFVEVISGVSAFVNGLSPLLTSTVSLNQFARNPVLSGTIIAVAKDVPPLEKLIAGLWLLYVSPAKALDMINAVMKESSAARATATAVGIYLQNASVSGLHSPKNAELIRKKGMEMIRIHQTLLATS